MKFYPLEKLHRLHDGYLQSFNVAGKALLLIQQKGELYLITNRCPHMDAPLTYATLKNGLIRCPMHGIEFDLQTGNAQGGAAACLSPLEKVPVVYENNQLGVVL